MDGRAQNIMQRPSECNSEILITVSHLLNKLVLRLEGTTELFYAFYYHLGQAVTSRKSSFFHLDKRGNLVKMNATLGIGDSLYFCSVMIMCSPVALSAHHELLSLNLL